MDHNTPGFPVLHYVLEFAQTHVCWASDAIQSSHPLLPPLLLPSVFPSIRVFSNELALPIRWPKVLELQLQHQSFQWRFRVDFLAVQGTLKSLLQHHNLKASLRCLRFLQDSCPTIEGPFWVLGKKSYPRPEIPVTLSWVRMPALRRRRAACPTLRWLLAAWQLLGLCHQSSSNACHYRSWGALLDPLGLPHLWMPFPCI